MYLLALIAGILAGGSLLVPQLWFASLFGVGLFAFALNAFHDKNRIEQFALGAVFGLAYSGAALFWLWDILPLGWAGISASASFALVYMFWSTISVALGVSFGIVSLAYISIDIRNFILRAFFGASLWVLVQYIQMWVFAFLMMGAGSQTAPHFSAMMLGYALASFSPFLLGAPLAGVYGLTFLGVLLGFVGEAVLSRYAISVKWKASALIFVLFVCIGATLLDTRFHLSPSITENEHMLNVGAVATDFLPKATTSEGEMQEHRKQIGELLSEASSTLKQLDLLVLPSGGFISSSGDDASSTFKSVFGDTAPAVLDMVIVQSEGGSVKELVAYSKDGKVSGAYDKHLLTPQAEYASTAFTRPIEKILKEYSVGKTVSLPELVSGKSARPIALAGTQIGGTVCTDIISPSLSADLANQGADLFINVCPDSWLHHGGLSTALTLSISKVRAAESGKFLVMIHNAASSAVISNSGEVMAKTPVGGISFMTAAIPRLSDSTLYSRIGEWILLLPLLVFLISAMFTTLFRRKV